MAPQLQFKECYGIDLVFQPVRQIAPHDASCKEAEWRAATNDFYKLGHRQSVKWAIGIDLATCVVYGDSRIPSQDSPSEEYKDELYDRVFKAWSPSTMAFGYLENERVNVVVREAIIQAIEAYNAVTWRDTDELEPEYSEYHGPKKSEEEKDRNPEDNPFPFKDSKVLIIDSGREDGLTTEICCSLCELGATVALAVEPNVRGRRIANSVHAKCRKGLGLVCVIRGLPYRSKSHALQPDDVFFPEDIIDEALRVLRGTGSHTRKILGRVRLIVSVSGSRVNDSSRSESCNLSSTCHSS